MLPPPGCRPLQFLHATCPGKSCSKGMISPVHTFSSSNNLSETVSQEKTRCVQSIGLLAGCRNRIKRRGELAHHWLLLRQCLCCISSSSILRIHLCVSRSTCGSYWLLLTRRQTMDMCYAMSQVQPTSRPCFLLDFSCSAAFCHKGTCRSISPDVGELEH